MAQRFTGWFHGLVNQRKNVCCGLGTLAIVNRNYYLLTSDNKRKLVREESIIHCLDGMFGPNSAETCGKGANGRFVEFLSLADLGQPGWVFNNLPVLTKHLKASFNSELNIRRLNLAPIDIQL